MTQLTHEEAPDPNRWQAEGDEEEGFVDPWSVQMARLREGFRRHRRALGVSGLALAAGVTGAIFVSRGVSGEAALSPGGRGAVPGPLNSPEGGSSVTYYPNGSPTPSSGGFNSTGRLLLECTGLSFQQQQENGHTVYRVTPKVRFISGDPTSPYVYTVVGTDEDRNIPAQGISSVTVDPSQNAAFPIVAIVDALGTNYGPNNPDALSKPLGDSVPDNQIFVCPYIEYPDSR